MAPTSSVNPLREAFPKLFQEFLNTYPATPLGQDHILSYPRQRQTGWENYNTIVTAVDSGEDITDLVLLKLIPYTDSANNRKRGAWIHIAPCIAGDIKTKFEAAGWTKSEDWKQVAIAIWQLVNRCHDHPDQLIAACAEFQKNPVTKGFQTGMLTPILNALRPDDFLLINNKSRPVINDLAGKSYGKKLKDYAAINSTGKALIQELQTIIKRSDRPNLRDDDLFDMFYHWLKAVKKYDLNDSPDSDPDFIEFSNDELGNTQSMSIPDFQTFLLPILQQLEDGQPHPFREVIESMAQQFQLSNDARKERLPSGRYGVFDSRVSWAKTYLKKAGLLIYPKRATLQITERGLQVLAENPPAIDVEFLKQFPDFNEFVANKKTESCSDAEIFDLELEEISIDHEVSTPRIWWVNQSKNLNLERAEGYITAPTKGQDGRKVSHWEKLKDMQIGDIVLHYCQGQLQYVSRVTAPAWIDNDADGVERRFVNVDYHPLQPPVALSTFVDRLVDLDLPESPIQQNGRVRQGYLFPLTDAAFAMIRDASPSINWAEINPSWHRPISLAKSTMAYWIFQANPNVYDLSGSLTKLDTQNWLVRQYKNQIRVGDRVFFWESGPNAGILALAEILTEPEILPEDDSEIQFNRDGGSLTGDQLRVRCRVLQRLDERISRQTLLNHPVLSSLRILKAAQGTNFPVTPKQADALMSLFPAKGNSNTLNPLFSAIFTDLKEANWAFDFLRDALQRLGVTAQERGLIALTFPTKYKQRVLRLNFGSWLVLDLRGPYYSPYRVVIALLENLVGNLYEQFHPGAFKVKPNEPQVILYQVPIELLKASDETFYRIYEQSFEHLRQRFQNWIGTPYGNFHQTQVAQAIFDPELRQAVLSEDSTDEPIKISEVEASITQPAYERPDFNKISQYVQNQSFCLDDRTLRRYHLALQSRGFVILSGVSGTGKTWLTKVYADAVGAEYCLIAVAPNWTSNEDLLGYWSPLDNRYHHTEFSQFLEKAATEYQQAQQEERTAYPYHLVLDEMNLARVEYYFAKFLSAMEIRQRDQTAEISLAPGYSLTLPPNLIFIGTVNVDETTHGFADKVYDRAQLLELGVDRQLLADELGNIPYRDQLLSLWDALHPVAPFAFRVVSDIRFYISEGEKMGIPWTETLDEQLLQKVLPKLRGMDQRVGKALQAFLQIIPADTFPLSHQKARIMQEMWNQHGIVSYF